MTPKEKAKDLIDKMYGYELDYMTDSQAKQCALIAVDELIEATSMRYEFRNGEIVEVGRKPLQYWLDVKNEINNL
jgi:hypothetical protein